MRGQLLIRGDQRLSPGRRRLGLQAIAAVLGAALAGVASTASAQTTAAEAPRAAAVAFIDIPKFDRELHAALSNQTDPVNVTFYEKVSPNKVPERLQKWISIVEKTGGKVDIEPPPDEPVPKGAFLLSLLGALWSAVKAFTEIQEESQYLAASKRNAVISLERDATRQIVVARVTFVARPTAP